ncbi:MAG TPA: cytochrome c3 family protein [bacterium]|nr:cytochrome c3 family protein [bacterium]
MRWLILIALSGLLTLPQTGLAQDNEACLACHQVEGTKITFPDGALDVTIDPKRFAASVHKDFTCTTCHTKHTGYPHPPRTAPSRRSYQVLAAQICMTCHEDQARVFDESVHGRGLRAGLGDVPICASCHTAHAVIRPKTAAFRNNIPEVCGNCHADESLTRRYGLRPVYQAYVEEFHGVTTRLYRLVTPATPAPSAVCYDCHTAHTVRRVSDPLSPVAPANLLATCRTCHRRAGPLFAAAWTEHREPSLQHSALVYLVQWFYRILIPATIAVLVLLTGLDLWHWAVTRWGEQRS